MTKNLIVGIAGTVVSIVSCNVSGFGPDWDEIADAGPLPISAQRLIGTGTIRFITGTLQPLATAGGDDEDYQDMYLIRIVEPTVIAFSASTAPALAGDADFDTRLWLFNADGFGLLANDDASMMTQQSTLLDTANDGTGIVITEPGHYFIAVSGADTEPFGDFTDQPMFSFASPTEITGPDGAGGLDRIHEWSSNELQGSYTIAFTGVAFLVLGDMDGDGDVDAIDRAQFCHAIGTFPGDSNHRFVADLNEDGAINHIDQAIFDGILPPCLGDVVSTATLAPPSDGLVDGADLAFLLGAWGRQASCADFVNSRTLLPPPDGRVDGADLATLLGAWGVCD